MLKMVGLDSRTDPPLVTVTRRGLADIIERRIDAAVTYTTDLKWHE